MGVKGGRRRLTAGRALLVAVCLLAPVRAAALCRGDLDDDLRVTIDELVVILGEALAGCSRGTPCAGDWNGDDRIDVAELVLAVESALSGCSQPTPPQRWWKGNLHTHSLWSDGDQYPEMVVDWYKRAGYDFVALSDHNVMAQGERWINVGRSAGGLSAYSAYRERFGAEWVESESRDGQISVRLRTLAEYRPLFEEAGRFLVLPGEEVTTAFHDPQSMARRQVCVGVTNLLEAIPPSSAGTATEVLQNTIDAVEAQRLASGQPMIAHVNHPNYGWALTADDIIGLRGGRFFEVFNGHPAARNEGDDLHPSTERLWDQVLIARLGRGAAPLFGTAVDDAHQYGLSNRAAANPGRGWVMVRAPELSPAAIIAAMEAGDFYASTGVVLDDVLVSPDRLALAIRAEAGVSYSTRFVGARRGEAGGADGSEAGMVLAEVPGETPVYAFAGDELYVRATILSSKPNPRVSRAGEGEMAWTQPVIVPR